MFKIFETEKFQEIKSNALQTVMGYQKIIDAGVSFSKSITSFAESRSPLSFVEGGISLFNIGVNSINGYSTSFFDSKFWEVLIDKSDDHALYDIIDYELKKFPFKKLSFKYETNDPKLYTISDNLIGVTGERIYFKSKNKLKNKSNDILQTILEEKFKNNNKIISVTERSVKSLYGVTAKYSLENEESIALPSKNSEELKKYINKYINENLSRSIILNGLPGCGKSTIAHEVFCGLGLRTIKFKYNKNINQSFLTMISSLITMFNVEAVFLDDFDYFNETTVMLDFLEWLHRHTKLVIAITNSLTGFKPAVLRPGRFDELMTIKSLDDDVIKSTLGNFSEKFFETVRFWPISYINELAVRAKVNPNADHDAYVEDLQKRVDGQAKALNPSN